MQSSALLLLRLQFAFTISFHIIFPAFTIGLVAWLTVLEALHLIAGRHVYRRVFEFWLRIFGVAFGSLTMPARHGADARAGSTSGSHAHGASDRAVTPRPASAAVRISGFRLQVKLH